MDASDVTCDQSGNNDDGSNKALHRLFWRVHFWAGLIASPIILFAAVTGLLYVFTPQIEAWRYDALDHVVARGERLPLDAQVNAARQAAPDAAVRYVVPGHGPADSTQVYLSAPHEHHRPAMRGGEHDHGLPTGSIAYIDPYSGQVLGHMPEIERVKTWAKKLHSSALQGDGWRWLMELGASWMLVLFATGLVMWWPRSQAQGGPGWRALAPRIDKGRATWRDLHASVALTMGAVLLVVLVTGLTWSRESGERFRAMQQAMGQEAPKAGPGVRSVSPGGGGNAKPMLSWQAAWERARAQAPDVAMQIAAPRGENGVWRIDNFDRSQPTGRFSLALDARSGETLFSAGWAQLPALARATAVGIPFHRGEFGVWNQALLVLAALAAVFSVVSGWVMWWRRRPARQLAAPPVTREHVRRAPLWLWPAMAALGWALPVFGWSLVLLVVLEGLRLWLWRARTVATAA